MYIFGLVMVVACSCAFFYFISATREASASGTRPVKVVYTNVGEVATFQLTSKLSRAIDYCRWDRTPLGKWHALSIISTKNNFNIQGYSINTNGLEYGFCQLTIQNVRMYDLTLWNCTIVDREISNEGVTLGTVNLTQTVKPSPPTLLNKNDLKYLCDTDVSRNTTVDLFCCAVGGHPLPKLSISIGKQVLMELEGGSTDSEVYTTSNGKYCIELRNVTLDWTFDGKRISCKAEHPGFSETDNTEDCVDLTIFHPPKIISKLSGNEISFVLDSPDYRFFIEFSANPIATVNWLIKGKDGSYEELPASFKPGLVENAQNHSWEAEIILNWDATGFTSAKLLLIVKNSLGLSEIHVNLQTTNQTLRLLVPIMLGSMAVLVFVGCLIFVARQKGSLCFQGRTGNFKMGQASYRPANQGTPELSESVPL